MTGKQRVEEILQKYSNAVVDEVVEKCVGGGIVVFAERAKAKRLEALDSIEEVMLDERIDELSSVGLEYGHYVAQTCVDGVWMSVKDRYEQLKEVRNSSAQNKVSQ